MEPPIKRKIQQPTPDIPGQNAAPVLEKANGSIAMDHLISQPPIELFGFIDFILEINRMKPKLCVCNVLTGFMPVYKQQLKSF